MALHEQIKKEATAAMLKKDELLVTVLRSLIATFNNELIAKKAKSGEHLDDENAITLIKRSVNQHKDSIEQFEKGGRMDLSATERAELAILESYLPAMMDISEIKKIAEKKMAELKISDKSKLGMLVGAVIKETRGKADGADVKKVVGELFT
jgi:uncharacterized protein YqeY